MDIEHAFSILKRQWVSLTGLRLLLESQKSYKFGVKLIITCCVLHNLLLNIEDNWKKHERWWMLKEEKNYNKELSIFG